jgi:GNAT superfamily N-acetyltransferase
VSVAQAHIWHLPRLLQILWAATRACGPVAGRRDEDARALGKLVLQGKVTVWRARGRVRAFLARDGVRLHALYTCPKWRGRGAGRALVKAAQKQSERLELYTAEANEGARGFYAAQGFREVRRGHGQGNDEGMPDIFMTWERLER